MPEQELTDLETLLQLARASAPVREAQLLTDLCNTAEKLYFRAIRAEEEVHHLADQVTALTDELANTKMLLDAASYTVLVADAAIVTAEHKVQALTQIIHPEESE